MFAHTSNTAANTATNAPVCARTTRIVAKYVCQYTYTQTEENSLKKENKLNELVMAQFISDADLGILRSGGRRYYSENYLIKGYREIYGDPIA